MTTPTKIDKKTFGFLSDLRNHNDREWFNTHKDRYLASLENVTAFTGELLDSMRKHDNIETQTAKECLMRIYRDTRFSKEKIPYKTHFGGGMRRATKKLRGGYYFQVGPGETLAAGGFFAPNPADLLRIRQDMDANSNDWQKLLKNKGLATTFGELKGDKVVTSPKGFSKDNPAIELLRHKQFYFERRFTDAEALAPDFLTELNKTLKNLRPYFDYMSEVLTTDANGVSLV